MKPALIKTAADSTAKVSLNDCLACSGCVTSAETVLITQQSASEVLNALADTRFRVRVASIAPQALASICAHTGMSGMCEVLERLTTWLHSLGFDVVLDTCVCALMCVSEACEEFCHRMERAGLLPLPGTDPLRASSLPAAPSAPPGGRPRPAKPVWCAPDASLALSSTRVLRVAGESDAGTVTAIGDPELAAPVDPRQSAFVPVLSSSCPGWVCYAEKAAPEALPYVSCVKSPQQLAGSIVKYSLSSPACVRQLSGVADADAVCTAGEVYHVTIMACYDRKLEASRKDFYWEASTCAEVDCVLTSAEIMDMLKERGEDLRSITRTSRRGWDARPMSVPRADSVASAVFASLEHLLCGVSEDGMSLRMAGTSFASSDAFAREVFRYTARKYDLQMPPGDVPFEVGKNQDFRSATLRDAAGNVALIVALAYGFRNIQTVVNKMKRGKCDFHYVEIMACPSGCINGGGQVRAGDGSSGDSSAPLDAAAKLALEEAQKAQLRRATDTLHACEEMDPHTCPAVVFVRDLLRSHAGAAGYAELVYTRYHHIPKLQTTVTKW